MENQRKIATACVHSGFDHDPQTGAVVPSISLATTYKQNDPGVPYSEFEYIRAGNPTRSILEKTVAELEHGRFGHAFSSGCMAMTSIAHLVGVGGHVLMINDVYGGTNRFFTKVSPNYGLSLTVLEMTEPSNLRSAITERTKLVWIESPTNPTLVIVDIRALCDLIHSISPDIIVVVDNTFLSPVFQNPLDLGADIAMHSATKYLNGHCDVCMGIAVTNSEAIHQQLAFYQKAIGGVPSPFDCYLVYRGIKTLYVRMTRHADNAGKVARFLEGSAHVARVLYPGLPSHPQHEIAKKQQRGFGGMVSVVLKGSLQQASAFVQATRLFTLAESLGGVESLIEIPAIMTHGSVSAAERAHLGISDSFLRLSVGIEDADDLVDDLGQALAKVFGA